MIGIYLLFFTTFLFLGEWISHLKIRKDSSKDLRVNRINPAIRAKYIFAIFATIFCALPIVYQLWDYYSLAKLFYSLFGGISVFSVLLMARFTLNCALRDFGKSTQGFTRFVQIFTRFAPKSQSIIAPKHTNTRAFFVILAFSFPLFLGHLDLIAVDIFSSSRAIVALFVGAFIIALYFADKITGILALSAFIIAIFMGDSLIDSTQGVIFALFDGYLLIYSFITSIVYVLKIIIVRK